ncbi:hypothetical protein C451_14560 [Halococcus thailandensis JCM 13552]|uniref:Uncharacterized protein n=1 Tax=Halococcus thailandensis JCM 13552 TaxID=1227457 RepID=M0N4A6_9EURY|nr:hypothetical protein C451_14560 [Halococcus thailandensis JCM 13552]
MPLVFDGDPVDVHDACEHRDDESRDPRRSLGARSLVLPCCVRIAGRDGVGIAPSLSPRGAAGVTR